MGIAINSVRGEIDERLTLNSLITPDLSISFFDNYFNLGNSARFTLRYSLGLSYRGYTINSNEDPNLGVSLWYDYIRGGLDFVLPLTRPTRSSTVYIFFGYHKSLLFYRTNLFSGVSTTNGENVRLFEKPLKEGMFIGVSSLLENAFEIGIGIILGIITLELKYHYTIPSSLHPVFFNQYEEQYPWHSNMVFPLGCNF